ncbi:transmembrane protein 14C-like [Xenia sp. Carnegie-2017]|uniref:transmembrane protein 14C-like n=1 Tax=Xenia sp. Carnegie-2017 TaxID=2897299 RepID=UPI001F047438|nr:transmembrane protein 14C-like [Xenia sp. Carnegie-2017]
MSMPAKTDYLSYGYAGVVALGGVTGYLKAGSVMSLAMGLLFGGFAGFGAMQTSTNPRNITLAVGTAGILTVVMGLRAFKSGQFKFMPAGLIFMLSMMQVGHLLYKSRS